MDKLIEYSGSFPYYVFLVSFLRSERDRRTTIENALQSKINPNTHEKLTDGDFKRYSVAKTNLDKLISELLDEISSFEAKLSELEEILVPQFDDEDITKLRSNLEYQLNIGHKGGQDTLFQDIMKFSDNSDKKSPQGRQEILAGLLRRGNSEFQIRVSNAIDELENEKSIDKSKIMKGVVVPQCLNCKARGKVFDFDPIAQKSTSAGFREVGVIYCTKCGYIVGAA